MSKLITLQQLKDQLDSPNIIALCQNKDHLCFSKCMSLEDCYSEFLVGNKKLKKGDWIRLNLGEYEILSIETEKDELTLRLQDVSILLVKY